MWGARRPRRVGRQNPYLYMMVVQAIVQLLQMERKPPATLVLIAANAVGFFGQEEPLRSLLPRNVRRTLPPVHSACINPYLCLERGEWQRLLWSPWLHADEAHLIYNMVSLLWKGVQLEGSLGTFPYLRCMAVLLLLSQGMTVGLAKVLDYVLGYSDPYYHHCAVGFSGVLFAMKVMLTWSSPSQQNFYGVLIPARFGAWAELLLIQYMVPQASFIGHLGGILAGLALVYLPRFLPSSFPLSGLLRGIVPGNQDYNSGGGRLRTRTYSGGGRLGRRGNEERLPGDSGAARERSSVPAWWRCSACTFDNVGTRVNCQMCDTPRFARAPGVGQVGAAEGYQPSAPPLTSDLANRSTVGLTAEDIRERRLARFARTS